MKGGNTEKNYLLQTCPELVECHIEQKQRLDYQVLVLLLLDYFLKYLAL